MSNVYAGILIINNFSIYADDIIDVSSLIKVRIWKVSVIKSAVNIKEKNLCI